MSITAPTVDTEPDPTSILGLDLRQEESSGQTKLPAYAEITLADPTNADGRESIATALTAGWKTTVTRINSLRPIIQSFWVKLKPVVSIVQPTGWAALVAAVICGVAGLWLDWKEFLVVALILGCTVVAAIVFVLGRAHYEVELDITGLRFRVGQDAFGGLTVTNTSKRAALPSVFFLPVGQAVSAFRVPRLAGEASHVETFQVDTSRRAVLNLGPVRSSRGDGIGLLRRDLEWTDSKEMFIHPKTISLRDSSSGFLKDLEGRPTDTLSSSDIAFHALRDYVVGDDLRHVHWKSTARTGKLLVRQFEETRRSHLVVCLSMTVDDYSTEADFEMAVSAAASLGEEAIRDEKDITIQAPGQRLSVHSKTRMLDDFARLEFGTPVAPIETVALDASIAVLDVSVAIIITGTSTAVSHLHAATSWFNADVRTVVLRCETGAVLSRGAIGRVPVLTIGHLDDLPSAMRSLEV